MNPNRPEHLTSVPDYRIDGREVLTPEQEQFCNDIYGLVCYELPEGVRPESVTANTQEDFTREVHAALVKMGFDRLPNHWVINMIDSYYGSFPSDRNGRFTQDERIAYQDTYIPIAHAHANRYGEVSYATALQHAFHARRQKRATAAMYGLLTAYGKTISALNPR